MGDKSKTVQQSSTRRMQPHYHDATTSTTIYSLNSIRHFANKIMVLLPTPRAYRCHHHTCITRDNTRLPILCHHSDTNSAIDTTTNNNINTRNNNNNRILLLLLIIIIIYNNNNNNNTLHLATIHIFVPIAVDTSGAWCSQSAQFIEDLGRKITAVTNEPLETIYLYQRLSVSLQRGNAVAFNNTFTET